MSKIPCEIVRDLLPSYVDQLTSSTTNQYIEEHLAECSPCKEFYEAMKSPEPEALQPSDDNRSMPKSGENKELDFLKKNRRRNKGILWGSIAVLLIILGVLFVTRYMIGNNIVDIYGDYFIWDLQVDGNTLSLDGRVVNDIFKITEFEVSTSDNIVYVNTKTVPSGFIASLLYGKEFHFDFDSHEPIRQVIVNSRILYNEGEEISMQASSIYLTRHLYIGDMSKNNYTANVLNISNYLGSYQNELQTATEPFGWTLHLSEDIPSERQTVREEDMESFAYVLIAVIDNLGEVTYDYTVDGKSLLKTITSQDATAFFGQDIKNCYADVSLLDELIQKTGLDHYAFGSVYAQNVSDTDTEIASTEVQTTTEPDNTTIPVQPISLNIVNNSEESFYSIMTAFYIDDELVESGGGINADETPIERGQLMTFSLDSEHLSTTLDDNSELEVEISVETTDGTNYEIPGRLRIPLKSGLLHDIHITGNAIDGFSVSQ